MLIYSLDELTDVTQGEYEYQYKEDSVEQPATTSTYQDSGSLEIPRYAPPPGPDYIDSSQAAYSSSPVNPSYTTRNFEDTTIALGSLTLDKGKERANGKFHVLCPDSLHSKLIVRRLCGATGFTVFNFILSCSFSHSHYTYRSARD